MSGAIFFTVCALIALVGALGTVSAQNPIRAAVGLLTTILGIAGLFLMLHAQFLAAIQIIVYAGAVVILFVFVIMVLGPDARESPTEGKAKLARMMGGALFGLLALGSIFLITSLTEKPTYFPVPRETHGTVEAVGGLLFSEGLVPFELSTALLIVAAIGAIAVARGKAVRKERGRALPAGRYFAGPVHPRDAGRPLPKEDS